MSPRAGKAKLPMGQRRVTPQLLSPVPSHQGAVSRAEHRDTPVQGGVTVVWA